MNPMAPIPGPDDRLARAEAALRDTSVPAGPSDDVVARTRAALGRAVIRPRWLSSDVTRSVSSTRCGTPSTWVETVVSVTDRAR
jgi:hypothetical protein